MISLEKQFESGAAGFSANPRTFTQLKRSPAIAMYEITGKGDDLHYGFEVFVIRIDPKGKVLKFPGGVEKTLTDDTENYPSNNNFGHTAFSFNRYQKKIATAKYEALLSDKANEGVPEVAKVWVFPTAEFTVGELAAANEVEYIEASTFIKAGVASGTIKFLREERRNARGKASNIYGKA